MEHSYIDEYSGINSFIHKLEPRIKLVSFFIFILFVIFTPLETTVQPAGGAGFLSLGSLTRFGLYGGLIGFLILWSKIPPLYVFKKSLVIIPFVLAIAMFIPFFKGGKVIVVWSFGVFKLTFSHEGLTIFWNCLLKAYLSILSMILLTASTNFSALLKALEKLRFPLVFIMIISFMYRYIFVVVDELMAMRQAKESRSPGILRWLRIKVLSNMLGVLFIRAYERAENVYLAMCSRGFDGRIKTMPGFKPKIKDFCFFFGMIFSLAVIRFFGIRNG